jgi:hypothetical protein
MGATLQKTKATRSRAFRTHGLFVPKNPEDHLFMANSQVKPVEAIGSGAEPTAR